jgi:hypothetical protein
MPRDVITSGKYSMQWTRRVRNICYNVDERGRDHEMDAGKQHYNVEVWAGR